MKLFPTVPLLGALLFSFPVFSQNAEECLKKFARLRLAMKITRITNDNQYNPGKDKNKLYQSSELDEDFCRNAKAEASNWASNQKQVNKSLEMISRELKKKGNVSGTYFNGIGETEKSKLSEKEICTELNEAREKSKDQQGVPGCPDMGQKFWDEYTSRSFETMGFIEACKTALATKRKNNAEENTCKEKAEAEKPKREAPGEEISPAGEPPVKIITKPAGTTVPVVPDSPAKTKSGGGAFRQ